MSVSPLRSARFTGATVLIASLAVAGAAATASVGGVATTVAGSYAHPRDAAFLADGSYLVASAGTNRIYRIADGESTVVAGTGAERFGGDGGPATSAGLKHPAAVAPLPDGGFLIADTGNERVRKVDASGIITTVAGTGDDGFAGDGGAAVEAEIDEPGGIVAFADEDFVFADRENDRVRKVEDGVITTVTDDVAEPSGVARRADGSILVADTGGDRVVEISPGLVQTDVPGATGLDEPMGVAALADGGVLVSDTNRDRVIEVAASGTRKTVAGDDDAGLDRPEGLAVDAGGRVLVANTHADTVVLLGHATSPVVTPTPIPGAEPDDDGHGEDEDTGKGDEKAHDDNRDGSKNDKPKKNSDGTKHEAPAPAETPAPVAPPALGESVVTSVASGKVRIRKPGTDQFSTLEAGASIPMGSTVDATAGAVRLTAAADASGATQTATFTQGAFKVTQTGGKRPITELELTGPLPRCPSKARKSVAAASAKRKPRRLWGDGKGRFRTKGQHSSATVRGTRWLTEDRCDGTLVRVVHGVVGVRDFAKKRTVTVRGGEKYLAKTPRARRRASR